MPNRKTISRIVIWIIVFALFYWAYSSWKSYQYQQRQQEQARQQAKKAELQKQQKELFDRYKTRLEAMRVLRRGDLEVQLFQDQAKKPFQTQRIPFVLEMGQEQVIPVRLPGGKPVRMQLSLPAGSDSVMPSLFVRDGERKDADWVAYADGGGRLFAQPRIKLSLRPSASQWDESVVLSAPKSTAQLQSNIKLFLLKPSRSRVVMPADENGKIVFKPDEIGLWRSLRYLENPDQPSQSRVLDEGFFFVKSPKSREQLNNAVKPFIHRLSRPRDESKDYQVNQLVRALAAYGRRGDEASRFVDQQLKLIRSKEPAATVKKSPETPPQVSPDPVSGNPVR